MRCQVRATAAVPRSNGQRVPHVGSCVWVTSPGLSTASCSGACAAGYYCPAGSTSPDARPCGSTAVYCVSGSSSPRLVPRGEYAIGDTNETMNSTLPCDSGHYCLGGVSYVCPAGVFGCSTRQYDPMCNGPCAAGYYWYVCGPAVVCTIA